VHLDELAHVEELGGPPVFSVWGKRPRTAWNKLTVARLVRIVGFEYLGERETYDLEVVGPYHNFVANGVITHNSVNEYSGRYSLMPLLFYRPEHENFALQSRSNRQGRGEPAPKGIWAEAVERWERVRKEASSGYEWMIGEDVARELARIDLPLSTYTQWYWKVDLHNLLHFLSLRADPHAQWEIQEYARVIGGMVKRVAPLSFEAWSDYQLGGAPMSRGELAALRTLLEPKGEDGIGVRGGADGSGEGATAKVAGARGAGSGRPRRDLGPELTGPDLEKLGLSSREVQELRDKLRPSETPSFDLDLSRMRTAESVSADMERAVPGTFE
jgi:thymidylate synthase (FAD)